MNNAKQIPRIAMIIGNKFLKQKISKHDERAVQSFRPTEKQRNDIISRVFLRGEQFTFKYRMDILEGPNGGNENRQTAFRAWLEDTKKGQKEQTKYQISIVNTTSGPGQVGRVVFTKINDNNKKTFRLDPHDENERARLSALLRGSELREISGLDSDGVREYIVDGDGYHSILVGKLLQGMDSNFASKISYENLLIAAGFDPLQSSKNNNSNRASNAAENRVIANMNHTLYEEYILKQWEIVVRNFWRTNIRNFAPKEQIRTIRTKTQGMRDALEKKTHKFHMNKFESYVLRERRRRPEKPTSNPTSKPTPTANANAPPTLASQFNGKKYPNLVRQSSLIQNAKIATSRRSAQHDPEANVTNAARRVMEQLQGTDIPELLQESDNTINKIRKSLSGVSLLQNLSRADLIGKQEQLRLIASLGRNNSKNAIPNYTPKLKEIVLSKIRRSNSKQRTNILAAIDSVTKGAKDRSAAIRVIKLMQRNASNASTATNASTANRANNLKVTNLVGQKNLVNLFANLGKPDRSDNEIRSNIASNRNKYLKAIQNLEASRGLNSKTLDEFKQRRRAIASNRAGS